MNFKLFSPVLGLLLSFQFQAQAQSEAACQPNYRVANKACITMDKIVGYTPVSVDKVRANSGACKPDVWAICNAHSKAEIVASHKGARAEDVRVKKAYAEDTRGKFCGTRVKEDVYCDFEFQAPVYEQVVDASCPIQSVEDSAKCFSADKREVNVSSQLADDCLNAKPTSEADLWVKAVCLADIYSAQKALRLKMDLPMATFSRIETQLNMIATRAGTSAELSSLIVNALRK